MVLHANLPEDLALVPAAHEELKGVLMGALEIRKKKISHTHLHRCHNLEVKNSNKKEKRVNDSPLLQYSHEPLGGA